MVDCTRKIGAFAGGDDHTVLTLEADWDGNAIERRGAVADVGNDLLAWERNARGEVAFEPLRKFLPGAPPRDIDCSGTPRVAQAHVSKVEVEHCDERIGKTGCHGSRLPSDPHGRNRGKGDKIPQDRLQAELLVRVDAH